MKTLETEVRTGPPITQVEFDESDFAVAEKIAKRLGYTQTAYTSTSALWGMFCLPDRASQKSGCIIKTTQFGFLFVADVEDMHMDDLKVGMFTVGFLNRRAKEGVKP